MKVEDIILYKCLFKYKYNMLFWVIQLKIRVISVDVTQVSDGKIDNNKTLDTDNDVRRGGRVEGGGGGGGGGGGDL